MSDLRIDLSGLKGLAESLRPEGGRGGDERGGEGAGTARAVARLLAASLLLAVLPFAVLIRGGVFAYREWGLGTWPALLLAVLATALLLGGYAWLASHRLGADARGRRIFTRAAMAIAVAYAAYGLVFVAGSNVKSDEVRAEYVSLHPLLRLASSALVLVDPGAVITDAGRAPEDYRLMGLPPVEVSLHFEQESGFVHALDLRTAGRGEIRNRLVQAGFWALGFRTLRHVGTADHLHVSLGLPE